MRLLLHRWKLYIKKWIYGVVLGDRYTCGFWDRHRDIYKTKPAIRTKFGWLPRVRCFLRGFYTDKLLWYDFRKFGTDLYISDLVACRDFEAINQKHYYYVHDKLLFERFMRPLCNLIPNLALLHNGRWIRLDPGCNLGSIADLMKSVQGGREYFLKPHSGGCGRGIVKLAACERGLLWNGEAIAEEAAAKLLKGMAGMLVQERFAQRGFSHRVYPGSLNSIRVVTMISPSTGEPFVAYAAHRFGAGGSFMDNVAQGNMFAPVDLKTGRLSAAFQYQQNGSIARHAHHPDTGIPIADELVPGWDKVMETALRLAVQIPFLAHLGWDMVLSDEQVYVQEANYIAVVYLGQVERPLLLDPRVREFYEHHVGPLPPLPSR